MTDDAQKRAGEIVEARRQAYARVFDRRNPDAVAVLEDLAAFCRFLDAPWHPDPAVRDILIGRREVFGRIAEHITHSTDDILSLYYLRNIHAGSDANRG